MEWASRHISVRPRSNPCGLLGERTGTIGLAGSRNEHRARATQSKSQLAECDKDSLRESLARHDRFLRFYHAINHLYGQYDNCLNLSPSSYQTGVAISPVTPGLSDHYGVYLRLNRFSPNS